jgi:hypothetical protein
MAVTGFCVLDLSFHLTLYLIMAAYCILTNGVLDPPDWVDF